MIGQVFTFLRNRLLERIDASISPEQRMMPRAKETVYFPNINQETPELSANINIILINVEEEHHMRPADPFIRLDTNGHQEHVFPPIYLTLHILIAIRPNPKTSEDSSPTPPYLDALNYFTEVVKCFQGKPIYSPEDDQYPDFPENVGKIVMELNPLTYGKQNEIWSSLKRAYLPSISYKVRMIMFQDSETKSSSTIEEVKQKTHTK